MTLGVSINGDGNAIDDNDFSIDGNGNAIDGKDFSIDGNCNAIDGKTLSKNAAIVFSREKRDLRGLAENRELMGRRDYMGRC
jgi:hypothetical protein